MSSIMNVIHVHPDNLAAARKKPRGLVVANANVKRGERWKVTPDGKLIVVQRMVKL